VSTKKASFFNIGLISCRTDAILQNLKDLFVNVLMTQCSCISNEAWVIPLPAVRRFICRLRQRLLVEWRKLDHSIVVAAITVSGIAVSLLVSGLTEDILIAFCHVFVVQCVKLMLEIFEFGVLLFDCFFLSQKCNLSEMFTITQVRWKTLIGRLTCCCLFSCWANN